MDRDRQMAQIALQFMQENMRFDGTQLEAVVAVRNWLMEKAKPPQEVPTMRPVPPFSEPKEASNE